MQLETLDYSWRSKDAAEIHFTRYLNGGLSEIGDEPPTELTAVMSNCSLCKPPTVQVPLDELELLIATHCEPRGGTHTKWNSNSKCNAYQWNQKFSKPVLLIHEWNGTGNHFMVMDQLELLDAMKAMIAAVPQVMIWDLIHSWFKAYDRGAEHAHSRLTTKLTTAFVNGTLKKRKNRGRDDFRVWIVDSHGIENNVSQYVPKAG